MVSKSIAIAYSYTKQHRKKMKRIIPKLSFTTGGKKKKKNKTKKKKKKGGSFFYHQPPVHTQRVGPKKKGFRGP